MASSPPSKKKGFCGFVHVYLLFKTVWVWLPILSRENARSFWRHQKLLGRQRTWVVRSLATWSNSFLVAHTPVDRKPSHFLQDLAWAFLSSPLPWCIWGRYLFLWLIWLLYAVVLYPCRWPPQCVMHPWCVYVVQGCATYGQPLSYWIVSLMNF